MSSPSADLAAQLPPYPERFEVAAKFAGAPLHEKLTQVREEVKLLLYALYMQAKEGECEEPKPWGWNVVESEKWNSWKALEKMDRMEAMRLYIKALEEDVPQWFQELQSENSAADTTNNSVTDSTTAQAIDQSAGEDATETVTMPSIYDLAVESSWSIIEASAARMPSPRYQHAAIIFEGGLFVVGGNCNGRYLSDTWRLDLSTLQWQLFENTGLAAIVGLRLVAWNGEILGIGGFCKDGSTAMTVRSFQPSGGIWKVVAVGGPTPTTRSGHSATLVSNSKIVVFGGEDRRRKLHAEVNILNLNHLVWEEITIKGKLPSPRSDHVATTDWSGKDVIVFGGGSHANCFNEILKFVVADLEWNTISASAMVPSPRAGHSGAILGSRWYICGGGNNVRGLSDLHALDTCTLAWHMIQSEEAGGAAAKAAVGVEGLTLLSTDLPNDQFSGILIAFGGYNGHYSNKIHVLKVMKGAPLEPSNEEELVDGLPPALVSKLEDIKKTHATEETRRNELQESIKQLDIQIESTATSLEQSLREIDLLKEELPAVEASVKLEKIKCAALEKECNDLQKANEEMQAIKDETASIREKVQEMTQKNKTPGGLLGFMGNQT